MTENNKRQSLKDLMHMKDHLEISKTHINFVENFLNSAIKREQESRRKDDKGGDIMNNGLGSKGEAVTITVVALAALIGFGAFLLGATNNPISGILGFNKGGKETSQKYVKTSVTEPIFVKGENGKEYILKREVREYSNEDIVITPKMTIWQKLMVLPRMWLILMVLGFFFPPIAGIMGMLNKRLSKAAKQIVKSVEAGLSKETDTAKKQEILDAMSKVQDNSTKTIVAKLKRDS